VSNIDELLSKLAPQGVEHLELGSLAAIHRGVRITKNDLISDGNVPVVSGGTGFMGFFNESNRSANTITIAQYGTAGYVNWQTREFWANDVCFTVEPMENRILAKYLYYFLMSKQSHLYSLSNRNAVPYSIERSRILSILVPVPPLEIQGEIVEILNSFQALEAELEAELEARRKQYEYYRNQLLSFPEQGGVRWVPLGEVGVFIRGNGMLKNTLVDSGMPAIHYGQIHTLYGSSTSVSKSFVDSSYGAKLRQAKYGDLAIATTAEDIEGVAKAVAWLGDSPAAVSGDAFIYRHQLNPLYASYFFSSAHFYGQKLTRITGTKVKRISGDAMARILIPVPTMEVQKYIGNTLQAFDQLISSIENGIPAEIKARKQQYEYYRDKLLSFKELKAS
jgi:type I restriction enzyme S subunit